MDRFHTFIRAFSVVTLLMPLAACQLTMPDFFKAKKEEPQPKEINAEPPPTTIVTKVPPILPPNLSEKFLLQPEIAYVPPARMLNRKSKQATAEVPLFDHVMAFSLPSNWVQTQRLLRSGYRKFEYAPKTRSKKKQSEISIEAFQSYNHHYSAQQLIDSYVKRAKARCRYISLYESLGSGELNGYKMAEAIYGCAASTRQSRQKSELSYVMVVEAGDNMYLLNKKIKVKPFKLSETPVTVNSVDEFLSPLLPIQICKESKGNGCSRS